PVLDVLARQGSQGRRLRTMRRAQFDRAVCFHMVTSHESCRSWRKIPETIQLCSRPELRVDRRFRADRRHRRRIKVPLDYQTLMRAAVEDQPVSYTDRDAMLYALGVGFCSNP